jgi:hypothetical protein
VSDATGPFVCENCGVVTDTWTAFCVRCGTPRAIHPVSAGLASAPAVVQRGGYGLTTEFAGLQPASVGRRVAAFSIDAGVIAIAGVAVFLVSSSPVLAALVAAEIAVGLLIWEGNSGRTIGNLLLRLRTTRVDEPRNPGLRRTLLRGLVLYAGLLVAVVGVWFVVVTSAFDRVTRRGWHDRVGRTVTLRVPDGPRGTSREYRVVGSERRSEPPRRTAPIVGSPFGAVAQPSGAGTQTAVPATPAAVPAGAAPVAPLFTALAPSVAAVRDLDAEEVERAEAIRFMSPTVVSTRMTVQEVDEDSADAGSSISTTGYAAQMPPTGSVMLLAFDTGQRVRVAIPGTGVLGRSPRTFTEGDQLVVIDDPDKSVSKSHLLFQITEDTVYVLDHASTNGSELIDDTTTRLPPDEWVEVPPGTRVRVGQRVFTLNRIEEAR